MVLGMARAILASGFGSGGEQEPSASYRVIGIGIGGGAAGNPGYLT